MDDTVIKQSLDAIAFKKQEMANNILNLIRKFEKETSLKVHNLALIKKVPDDLDYVSINLNFSI